MPDYTLQTTETFEWDDGDSDDDCPYTICELINMFPSPSGYPPILERLSTDATTALNLIEGIRTTMVTEGKRSPPGIFCAAWEQR
jgi:hypothetical protein